MYLVIDRATCIEVTKFSKNKQEKKKGEKCE